jgi:hypothetical protein
MKIVVAVVGKAKGAVGEAIGEYEARARRYFAGPRDHEELLGRLNRCAIARMLRDLTVQLRNGRR